MGHESFYLPKKRKERNDVHFEEKWNELDFTTKIERFDDLQKKKRNFKLLFL